MDRDTNTYEILPEYIGYDPYTGEFRWLKSPGSRSIKRGMLAGHLTNGHMVISVKEQRFSAAKAAIYLVENRWPEGRVAYHDGNPQNLTYINLYEQPQTSKHKHLRNARDRDHRQRQPEVYQRAELRRNFGLGADDYASAKIVEQNGVCAICRQPETETRLGKLRALSLDHNHSASGADSWRGLLCQSCNKAYGLMRENREFILGMLAYHDKWHSLALSDEDADSNIVPLRSKEAS